MSLEEVYEIIEAFKEDMKKIGVPVSSAIITPSDNIDHDIAILLRTFVKRGIEDQEAEG